MLTYFIVCVHMSILSSFAAVANAQDFGQPLPGTQPLTMTGDIASQLVAGVDRFLLKQIDESVQKRPQYWKRDFSSVRNYDTSVESNRKRLAHILGVRDRLTQSRTVEHPDDSSYQMVAASGEPFSVRSIRWPAFGDVNGEGLESTMHTRTPMDTIIVIPDADQTPEQLFGLVPGVPAESQVARRLAENGYKVIVPALIDRTIAARNGRAKLTNREFVYRSAFELGRHVIGYEVQKVLALVELASHRRLPRSKLKTALFGYGEGGAIALYAAALDPRMSAVCSSGYFDDRNDVWRQPVDRNVFGLLEQFGDAEVASLIAPRPLIVEAAKSPEVVIPPGTGGAPGRLTTPGLATVAAEVDRARTLISGLKSDARIDLVKSGPDGTGPFGSEDALQHLLEALTPGAKLQPLTDRPGPRDTDPAMAVKARHARQLHELDRHNQQLLIESARSPPRVHEESRPFFARQFHENSRALSRIFRQRGHRPVRPGPPAPKCP